MLWRNDPSPRSLGQIAADVGGAEVLQGRRSSFGPGDQVIDMEIGGAADRLAAEMAGHPVNSDDLVPERPGNTPVPFGLGAFPVWIRRGGPRRLRSVRHVARVGSALKMGRLNQAVKPGQYGMRRPHQADQRVENRLGELLGWSAEVELPDHPEQPRVLLPFESTGHAAFHLLPEVFPEVEGTVVASDRIKVKDEGPVVPVELEADGVVAYGIGEVDRVDAHLTLAKVVERPEQHPATGAVPGNGAPASHPVTDLRSHCFAESGFKLSEDGGERFPRVGIGGVLGHGLVHSRRSLHLNARQRIRTGARAKGTECAQSVPESELRSIRRCVKLGGVHRRWKQDLEQLRQRAFHRWESAGELLVEVERRRQSAPRGKTRRFWQWLHGWLLAPLTTWPIQIDDLVRHVLSESTASRALSGSTELILELLGEPEELKPDDHAVLQEHEQDSQTGNYQVCFPRQWHKFSVRERSLISDRELQRQWERLRAGFDVTRYQDAKGIVRRTMLPERNFRPGWRLDLASERSHFQAVFDLFCWRWNLYGMARDTPLLTKPTVSGTPLGTLIFIPRYWAFDPSRDLDWKAIRRIHRAVSGPHARRVSIHDLALLEESKRAWDLDQEARKAGLRGQRRADWVMGKLGWPPGTDESRLRRRIRSYETMK